MERARDKGWINRDTRSDGLLPGDAVLERLVPALDADLLFGTVLLARNPSMSRLAKNPPFLKPPIPSLGAEGEHIGQIRERVARGETTKNLETLRVWRASSLSRRKCREVDPPMKIGGSRG